jgi:hypothetical protein
MSASRAKRGLLLLAGSALIVSGGAGVAYAAGAFTGGTSPVIVGCAKVQNGQLRIVGDASQCLPGENAVAFAAPAPPAGPTAVSVDCGAGQSVQQAIDQADPNQPLTVNISGTCTEQVGISRDDVMLHANGDGSGIQAPVGGFAALALTSARRIGLDHLTLSGGQNVLEASNGSSFNGNGLQVSGGTNADVDVQLSSSGQLNNATIDHAGQSGVNAGGGGSLAIGGSTISGDQVAVRAQAGGSVSLFASTVHGGAMGFYAFDGAIDAGNVTIDGGSNAVVMADGGTVHLNGSSTVVENGAYGIASNNNGYVSISPGTRVTGNANGGIIAFNSGALNMTGVTVDHNHGNGITLANASSADIHQSTISDNESDGINILDTSVAQFDYQHGTNTVTGNGRWGVFCGPAPDVAMIRFEVGDVSGNQAGQNNCPRSMP